MRTVAKIAIFLAAFVAVALFGSYAEAATGARAVADHGANLIGVALSAIALGALAQGAIPKNSGILRYVFGNTGEGRPHFGNVTSVPTVICCLGASAGLNPDNVTSDSDGQYFGPTPGHGAIAGFDGAAALVAQPGDIINPGVTPHAPFYIPGNTKVHAYFIATDPTAAGLGAVAVRTQVDTGRVYAGVVPAIVDPNGAQYLALVRVSVATAGNATAAGILVVELQHSEHDIPGFFLQNQDATVPLP